MEPVVTQALSKRFRNGVLAVDGLDLTVRRGEVYGFLGQNGAGKTTTLRMLLGLARPSSGTATVAGHPPGAPAGMRRVGSLVETPGFYPYLSGRDNLTVLAHLARVPPSHIDEVLEQVGLRSRSGDRFAGYSLGMKQRLGVAAALLKRPELLILDEPTNGLDPQGVLEMRALIRRLGGGGWTVLLSSHQLGEVEQICDRVGVIHRGRLIAEGTVRELRGSAGLLLRASPKTRARRRLTTLLGRAAVGEVDGRFALEVDPRRAGEINTALVSDGLVVSELRTRERPLEETFLRLTRGTAP
jgi:ABC-type multidrug transport system ATPase subunit